MLHRSRVFCSLPCALDLIRLGTNGLLRRGDSGDRRMVGSARWIGRIATDGPSLAIKCETKEAPTIDNGLGSNRYGLPDRGDRPVFEVVAETA